MQVLCCALIFQLPNNTKDAQDAQKQDRATRLATKFLGNNSSRVSILFIHYYIFIREYGSTLYVGLARAVSPTNTNFRLSFLLT